MISDDERREVAARLRELPSDTYAALKRWEEGGLFIDASIGDEADYSQIHNAIIGCFPAEHMHPGDYEELHELLADLIDRPTCQMVECTVDHGSRSWGMCCTACGKEFEHVKPGFGWRYCPNCGAEVVEEGGCDVRGL